VGLVMSLRCTADQLRCTAEHIEVAWTSVVILCSVFVGSQKMWAVGHSDVCRPCVDRQKCQTFSAVLHGRRLSACYVLGLNMCICATILGQRWA
jgi:hypothetical protein